MSHRQLQLASSLVVIQNFPSASWAMLQFTSLPHGLTNLSQNSPRGQKFVMMRQSTKLNHSIGTHFLQ
jgi:hypothetical protein